MRSVIKISSYLIILLGIIHISFAFPIQMNEGTLWFVGSGFAVIFAGLLNLVAIDRGGSRFTKFTAAIVNGFNTLLFFGALKILNESQVYIGIAISLTATVSFIIEISRERVPQ